MNTVKQILLKLKDLGGYVIDTDKKMVVTREQIGETISTNYSDAVEALEAGVFAEAFEASDSGMNEILKSLEGKYADSNQVIFYLQYELNPSLPFTYKEVLYRDISSLGNAILNGKAEKKTILECIRFKFFSFYAKFKQLDLVRSDIIERINFAENYFEKDREVAYILMGYILSDCKYYMYDGKKFLSVVTLYTYLTDKKKVARFAQTMEEDIAFISWLYSLGNVDTFEKWKETVKKIDMLDYETYTASLPQEPVEVEEPKKKTKVKKEKEKVQSKKIERVKVKEEKAAK